MIKAHYNSAMGKLKISSDFNDRTLTFLAEQMQEHIKSKSRHRPMKKSYVYGAIITCVLIGVILTSLLQQSLTNHTIDLQLSTGNVSVKFVDHFPSMHTSADLQWLSEEEIFAKDTSIFQGEIVNIRNVEIEMGSNRTYYRAIASVKITESYRGDETVGDIVDILLPGPIDMNIWVEDTGVSSAMRAGMVGIFMPVKYNESHYRKENNATLYLMELSEYGLLDGERFAFLQTDDGMLYAKWAYESIPENATLEDIEAFVLKMIN